MTGVIALLVGSVVVGLHGPRVLLWLGERRVDPTILLTGWVLSTVGLVVSVAATIGVLALPTDAHPSSGIFELAGGCWTALSAGVLPGWGQLLAALSVLCAALIFVRVVWATTVRLRRRRARAPHLDQLRLLAARVPAGEPLWVRDDLPIALSVGGRPGLIVLSDGLRAHLDPAQLEATLEHERAHLRGRHHLLLATVETLAAALPLCPLLRTAPAAVADLIELSADAQAARRCGAPAVQEALARLTGHPTPSFGLAMAGHLTQVRLLRLAASRGRASRVVRWVGCTAVAVAALVLPAATGWLALNIVGCAVT